MTTPLDDATTQVLKTLNAMGEPAGAKAIANQAGLDEKVVAKLTARLKKDGLIDSPIRCKYAVTEAGRKLL